MDDNHILVMITVPSNQVGQKIATLLVENRLAACVNIIPGITSIYRRQKSIEQDGELLLIAKTRGTHFKSLALIVRQVHPYDVPEIIAIPIVAGSTEYLNWIDTETSGYTTNALNNH